MSNEELIVPKLIGNWECPGSDQFELLIDLGDTGDQFIVRNATGEHWSEGTATVTENGSIFICFDTGVNVTGQLSEDLNQMDWDNGTVWYRQSYQENNE